MSSNLDAKKATKIHLFNFSSAAMRAFHMSWLAFFVCFFAWFACAPLMPVIAAARFGAGVDALPKPTGFDSVEVVWRAPQRLASLKE